ncbi:MAG: hydroxymethylglutaryl-CoA lyase [Streptosporangiales bacterium]|nr:hydroxymethylglutaryl-CoA lyase [Streptosporangiales bacterium]
MTGSQLPLPAATRLVEVGLRDGLQTVEQIVDTADKVAVARALIDAGVTEIEAVSFAHPRVLPQFADAAEVMAQVPRVDGVRYRGLVPNVRGAERAADCGLDGMVALACADEGVARINQNSTVADILAGLPAIGQIADRAGAEYIVGVAMAFFAPGRGLTPEADRMRCVDAAVDADAHGVYLACSTGMEDPRQVHDAVCTVKQRHPGLAVGVHLHARNGMATATALAALLAGADWLEGAFGGLGGDLWAPGAPEVLGNAPFEDLVHLTASMGIETGIDLTRYLRVVRQIEKLTGWTPLSAVVAGGTREELAAHRWPTSQPTE